MIQELRADLERSEFRTEAIQSLIGASTEEQLRRGVVAPARFALSGKFGNLSTLVRLFLLGELVSPESLDDALPSLGVEGAQTLGLVRKHAEGALVADVSLNPVQIFDEFLGEMHEWWVLSDLDDHLRRGPAKPDHVMGVGGATRSLISQLSAQRHDRALDLGTGCGVVAMHLALRGDVVATDISARALRFAKFNAQLNGLETNIEFRQGDLFAPVVEERFDFIASNPPFVITPRGDNAVPRYDYRDGGMIGDELAQTIVQEAPKHLQQSGRFVCLANWESPWGSNGLTRTQQWIENAAFSGAPLAAWVIERDRLSPAAYAEMWARDGGVRLGGEEFELLMQAWLEDFAARKVTSIGMGSIHIQRLAANSTGKTMVRLDEASGAFAAETLGADLSDAFAEGLRCSTMSDQQILDARWLCADDVSEHRQHVPGQDAPNAINLRVIRPIARDVVADTLLAAAVGACDGDLTMGQIAAALAEILEVDIDGCSAALTRSVRELTWLGMLTLSSK